jgi:hypothetical protein
MSSRPEMPPKPGSPPPGKSFRNAAADPPASRVLVSADPGLAGRVEGMPPANAPPVVGILTKLGTEGSDGVRPAAGNVPALGCVPVLRRAPLGNEVMPELVGRRLTAEPGRIPGVGRLPYVDRAVGVRLANPLPLGRLNEEGRAVGRDIDGVRPVAPPKLERGARIFGAPP